MIPNHLMSEANIQAEFYSICKQVGLNCALELTTPAGRVDCGIFSDDWEYLIAIVECKHNQYQKVFLNNQIRRYKQIGVPIYGLARMNSLSLAMTIKNSNYKGTLWAHVCSMQRIKRHVRL